MPPPILPVLAERGGTQLKTPLPVLLVDSREQDPFDFAPYAHWFSAIRTTALELGDYAIEGMEDRCVVERKNLSDLVQSLTQNRDVFRRRLQRMALYPDRLLVVDAPFSQVQSRYPYSGVHPNQIVQSLMAIMTGPRIQILLAETHAQGALMVAWYLCDVFLYRWLEVEGYGRVLVDGDL